MNLVRFDPFRELEEMSARLNRLFSPTLARLPESEAFGDFSPAIDIQETDKEYLVKADLPEVLKADVKVGIDDGMLTIQGERKMEKEEKGKKFHRVERAFGKFVRRLVVPVDIDKENILADFKDGVLTVKMPKIAIPKPKAIDIKVA